MPYCLPIDRLDHINERKTGEMFESTEPNKRVMCTNGRNCKLRIDKSVQIRGTGYGDCFQFAQNERYLTEEDLDIIKYYTN